MVFCGCAYEVAALVCVDHVPAASLPTISATTHRVRRSPLVAVPVVAYLYLGWHLLS